MGKGIRFILLLSLTALFFPACGKDSGLSPVEVGMEARTEGPLTVLVAGDTMLDDLALPYIKKYGYGYPLDGVRDLLLSADIVNVNLETVAADSCRRVKNKQFTYFTKPEGLEAMKNAGINVAALANNHSLDCGEKGLEATLANLDRAGIAHYGAGINEGRYRGVVIDVKGARIGFAGWYASRPSLGSGGTAPMTEEAVRKGIAALKAESDLVIATFHWGKNYKKEIETKQEHFGRMAVDAGADAVIGHHPHISQPMELYRGKPIVYSVGNFVFSTGNNASDQALAVRLTIDDQKIVRLDLIPLVVKNRDDRVRWQPRPATGSRAEKILAPILSQSGARGATLTLQDNLATMTF